MNHGALTPNEGVNFRGRKRQRSSRFFLEQKDLASSTINVRLAAVRRLAYEASDTGLLSPELAAGIRRVKGAKRVGVRIGNWLTVEQSRTLLSQPPLRMGPQFEK